MENSGPGSTSVRRLNSPMLAWSFRQNNPERPESFSSWPEVALGFSHLKPEARPEAAADTNFFFFFKFEFFFLNWLDLGLAPIEEEEELEESIRSDEKKLGGGQGL